MEHLFLRVLALSLSCSVVILPLLLLGQALRGRYTARTLYFLWLLLALRLLVPVQLNQSAPPVSVAVPVYMLPVTDRSPPPDNVEPEPIIVRAVSATAVGAAVWGAGVLGVLLWQGTAYLIARRRLMRGAQAVELALPSRVRAVRSTAAPTPMMLGAVRPVLVLPTAPLDEATLDVVLRHELCHLRRRDVAYKALMLLVCAVYWFHPLVWLMAAEAGRNLELCCDDDVLKDAAPAERRRYGEILLAACAEGHSPAFSTRFGSPKYRMKERLENLFGKKKTGAVLVCVLLVAVVAVGSSVALWPETEAPVDTAPGTPAASTEPEGAWQWPVEGEYGISAAFGRRVHPVSGEETNHGGADIAAPEGTEVRAARSGVVSVVAQDETLGNYVKLAHKDVGMATVYGQLSAVAVQEGDRVTAGQTIGSVGSTGSSTGAHLHFELWADGERVDPLSLYSHAFYHTGERLGGVEDEGGVLIDEDVAIYVQGRKAVYLMIELYHNWVAAGENEEDIYDYAERVIYQPVGKSERVYMTIDDYKAWVAAGEQDAEVYDFSVPYVEE